jgi:hypothetical protein
MMMKLGPSCEGKNADSEFENRVRKRVFEPKSEEGTGIWRKLCEALLSV